MNLFQDPVGKFENMSIKIATINIEHGRHLPELFDFVKREQPDVLCMQEVFEVDVDAVKRATGMEGFFHPSCVAKKNYGYPIDPRGAWGVLLMFKPSQLKILDENDSKCACYYYVFTDGRVPEFTCPTSPNKVVQVIKFIAQDQEYIIANTHFNWSANGRATKLQCRSFARLSRFLSKYPELILCGDFNAPRGGEIFSLFTQRFTDNIPPDITTTIDSSKHYSGKKLDLVVDNIFTTPGYKVSNVRVITGISDHCAVVGEVEGVAQESNPEKPREFGPLKG